MESLPPIASSSHSRYDSVLKQAPPCLTEPSDFGSQLRGNNTQHKRNADRAVCKSVQNFKPLGSQGS